MQSEEIKRLYIFDFDGTITKTNSLFEFIKYSFSKIELMTLSIRFFPTFVKQILGLISNSIAKESLYRLAFKGIHLNQFNKKCKCFSENVIPLIIYNDFIKYIDNINKSNSEVYIVSASIDNYLNFWTSKNRFKLISTKLEFKDDIFTGYFSTPNCNYEEKKRRIINEIDLSLFDEIHIFGNSKGDFAMLELATHKYYKFFKH